MLDSAKSDFGRLSQSALAKAEQTLVVVHQEPELKITRKIKLDGQEQSQDYAYYSDGRGETNPPLIGRGGEVKSKTKWDGAKLVAKASTSQQTPDGALYIETTQKWELAEDGKTLTETVSRGSPGRGVVTVKQVFARAP